MDDFDDDYRRAVEAGESNLRAKKLLNNWCLHAEIARSGGIGMIEESTGLPIGHMGVRCKFSKKNSMHCWRLEDSIYDFYRNNCANCEERVPVGDPNILSFVSPREKAAEERQRRLEEEANDRRQKQLERQSDRNELRQQLSLEESFVIDLLDEIDNEELHRNDPRLEQLASLAPETFTRRIIDLLLPAALDESLPYSIPSAKALLGANLEASALLSVAVQLVSSYVESPEAIDVVLSNAESIKPNALQLVMRRFVSMALGPSPRMASFPGRRIVIDPRPIQELFSKRHSDISVEIDSLLRDANVGKLQLGTEILLALDNDDLFLKHTRTIFVKLIRKRVLLSEERGDSDVLYYLREAASECYKRFPSEADRIVQAILKGADKSGVEEAHRAYRSALRYEYGEALPIGEAQKIAFKRLLWSAVENPGEPMSDASQFFRHPGSELSDLAVEQFDELIGAAATLSEKYEQVTADSSIAMTETVISSLELSSQRWAIDGLQTSLIELAAVGARTKGTDGITDYLELYRRLPESQTRMRANMILQVSKLLSDVSSLNLVLSDWYRALMDESPLVRANAARAWEDVPFELVKNLPDLFFQAFSVLFLDPYVIVHRSAVRSLRHRSFPKDQRDTLKNRLWRLIAYYFQHDKEEEFIVDCIDTFAYLCLPQEERRGPLGKVISGILLELEGLALYKAVDHLHRGFNEVPGYVRVALKAIQNEYTRSISMDDCVTAILQAPEAELKLCVGEIVAAFYALKPFRAEGFVEALVYATALAKIGEHEQVNSCFLDLVESIPSEDRSKQWKLSAALIAAASDIENAIVSRQPFDDKVRRWGELQSRLEEENAERAKLRDFPSSFFFED